MFRCIDCYYNNRQSLVQRPQRFFGVQIDCTLRLVTYVTSRAKGGNLLFFSKISGKCIVDFSNYYCCFFATKNGKNKNSSLLLTIFGTICY